MAGEIGRKLADQLRRRIADQQDQERRQLEQAQALLAKDAAMFNDLLDCLEPEVNAFNAEARGIASITLSQAERAGPCKIQGPVPIEIEVTGGRFLAKSPALESPLAYVVNPTREGNRYQKAMPPGMTTREFLTDTDIVAMLMKIASGLHF